MTANPRRAPIPPLAWLLLALSAAVCVVWFVHARGFWEDDAFIHLEFARSLANGQGFSFNGQVVYGDTSPLWVLLLVAFHAIIPGWLAAGKALTVAAAIFTLTAVFFFSRALALNKLALSAASLFAATMVLITVVNPYFGYWAFSGMEALAAVGVVCWGLLAVIPNQLSTPRFLLGCLAAGVAPILRPEMSFFTILLGLLLLERLIRMNLTLSRRIARAIAGLATIALPTLLWASYALHTFGMLVPNTNAAKRAAPGDAIVPRLLQVYGLGFPVILVALALLAAWLLWYALRGRSQKAPNPATTLPAAGWLIFLWTAVNSAFYILDHTYVQTRYIYVTAPVLTIALLAIAAQRSTAIYRALLAVALICAVGLIWLSGWRLISSKADVVRVTNDLAAVLRTLSPDAGVADYSIGAITFLSQHPIVDTGGITRPGILPLLADKDETRRVAWIYTQGGRYEVIDHPPVPGSTLVWSEDLSFGSWSLHRHPSGPRDVLMLWKLPPPPSQP